SELWLSNAAVNVATDITMMFLPIFMLWHVQIPRRQKIGLLAIFMTGFFVCAVSIVRLYYQVKLKGAKDMSWKSFATAMWSTIELHVGLICASLPHAKPFLRHHFPKLLGTSGDDETSETRRAKDSFRAVPIGQSLRDEDEISLCEIGNDPNGGIPLRPFNSAAELSNTESISLHTFTREDQSAAVPIQAGEFSS
ncbi:hypothetical protein CC80DRAFT_403355, partial [Byssothecium circinans]